MAEFFVCVGEGDGQTARDESATCLDLRDGGVVHAALRRDGDGPSDAGYADGELSLSVGAAEFRVRGLGPAQLRELALFLTDYAEALDEALP